MIREYNTHVINPHGKYKVAFVKTTKKHEMNEIVYNGTRTVIELLLKHNPDFRKFVSQLDGKIVLVKPNLTKHPPVYNPHNKMTTDPFAVKSIIDWLLEEGVEKVYICLLYTSPSPRDRG